MAELDEWKWIPSSLAVVEQPKVQVIAFGDGYEARMALGIHPNLRAYTMTFAEADPEVMGDMATFLRNKGALEKFLMLTAGGAWVPVVARSWSAQYGYGVGELTVELQEVAEL